MSYLCIAVNTVKIRRLTTLFCSRFANLFYDFLTIYKVLQLFLFKNVTKHHVLFNLLHLLLYSSFSCLGRVLFNLLHLLRSSSFSCLGRVLFNLLHLLRSSSFSCLGRVLFNLLHMLLAFSFSFSFSFLGRFFSSFLF